MLNLLKNLFSLPAEEEEKITYQKAVASLLMEVMLADFQVAPQEEQEIKRLLKEVTDLGEDIDQLYIDARAGVEEANDLYQFTRVINEKASLSQKMDLLKALWHVALSDGSLDAQEDHRIRRISELLFMPHSEFIQAKLAVQQELQSE